MGLPALERSHSAYPVPVQGAVGDSGASFPPQAEEMISEIRAAFEVSLDQLDWMDEATRQAAKEKVTPGGAVGGRPPPVLVSTRLHLTARASPHAGGCHLRHDRLP